MSVQAFGKFGDDVGLPVEKQPWGNPMRRREFITLLGGATVSSHKVWAQQADSRVADLLRAGKIRVALFLPLYAKDPVTGELRGNLDGVFLIEIIHALAARLGVETQLVGYPTPPEAMSAIKAGVCDVGFFGIDPIASILPRHRAARSSAA